MGSHTHAGNCAPAGRFQAAPQSPRALTMTRYLAISQKEQYGSANAGYCTGPASFSVG